MKNLLLVIAIIFLLSSNATAAPHNAVLTWTASTDGGAVTVYRAPGACSSSSVFVSITTGVAANTFTDSTVTVGSFCYQVTTVVNGNESKPSNQVTAVILPSPPSGLTEIGN
jgi:hypothetical protein